VEADFQKATPGSSENSPSYVQKNFNKASLDNQTGNWPELAFFELSDPSSEGAEAP
jgi:hypothetical protein